VIGNAVLERLSDAAERQGVTLQEIQGKLVGISHLMARK